MIKRAEGCPENDLRRNDPRYQGVHFNTKLKA